MYSLKGHGDMIADAVRMGAYERALRATVKPGSVVVDIGTGVGLFAILAARLGARRVYAIESSDMIEVARAAAAANGCAGRIRFFHDLSTNVVLDERADVVVSDLRGVLPHFQAHLQSIVDARERFLAPGGTLIPARDRLWISCVEAPGLHRPVTSPWRDNVYGLDLSAAHAIAANRWCRAVVDAQAVVTPPACFGELDYASVGPADLDSTVTMELARDAAGHGLCAWFDSDLIPGVSFSNAPGHQELIYGRAFFPWPEAIALRGGDRVVVRMRARRTRPDYLWTWESRITRGAATVATFLQSDFFGEPLARDKLHRHAATHVARLSEQGHIDAAILELMRDSMPLGDIAHRIAEGYPGHFARWQDALARVAELSARYGRSA